MNEIPLSAKLGAEALGTFWLVLGGCGAAVLAATFLSGDADPIQLGIGFLGVALAFGLTVLTGAFAFGHVSGGHFNPAVSIGLAIAKRFDPKLLLPYIVTQIVANGYGDRSPGGYSLLACFVIEVVLTAVFLYIILGATDDRAPKGFAPIAIGLGLTLIHLVSIPVTNTSVNPARSLGVAWFAGPAALGQVWLFFVAPIIGAAIAGATYALITASKVALDEGVGNNPNIGTAKPAND